jgi:hypothetical protein
MIPWFAVLMETSTDLTIAGPYYKEILHNGPAAAHAEAYRSGRMPDIEKLSEINEITRSAQSSAVGVNPAYLGIPLRSNIATKLFRREVREHLCPFQRSPIVGSY